VHSLAEFERSALYLRLSRCRTHCLSVAKAKRQIQLCQGIIDDNRNNNIDGKIVTFLLS